MSQGDSSTMVRLHPHQRLSFDTASRSLRDGGARSRDCSPNPRERSSRDRSARERSPQRSPLRTRRAPSPLRHAQFRPLAMEYANSHENSPQPTSCKYYNAGDEEEATPGGTPGGYCSTYRTVGYSTVGNKNFMSGKCPHCRRLVTSDTQICTPNATPPQSPWKVSLQSPLRSPLRTNRTDGQSTLQSPIRSPFKGSFFGGPDDDSNKPTSSPKQSPKHSASIERSRSPARGASPTRGSTSSPTRSMSPTRGTGGGGSTSPARLASPIRSPLRGSFFETYDEPTKPERPSVTRTSSTKSPASTNRHHTRNASSISISVSSSSSNHQQQHERHTRSPSRRTPVVITGGTTRSRSRSPTRSPRPIGDLPMEVGPTLSPTRGPRSPGPRSPAAARSPWKGVGGSFFGNPQPPQESEEEVYQAPSKSSPVFGRSRGAHSPGPRSPLRVSVAFFDEEGLARQKEEERAAAAEAAAGTPKKKQEKKGGWRSPLRSPFKGSYFGSSPKAASTGVKVQVGSE